MKLVVTIVGRDQVGIVAMVSGILAEQRVNIMNVNQNIMDGFFNMVMIAEMPDDAEIRLKDLQELLREKGEESGLQIKVQHQDIFQVMHSV
ncbi:ACT domain-containing protein [Selenomonas sp. oral taxon 138]|uniref:ACT domain-containing protein n=1 Tax=Selenomonas sp. oral taxon 138 TaxID=712532 RepID=UPI0002A3A34B|nr:ACT domain-containing protein [Selenomonas sp. oral taxon 138]EKX99164.1 ACT domain protein [Selenomonas sp. oral taxon 138 str. F0429]